MPLCIIPLYHHAIMHHTTMPSYHFTIMIVYPHTTISSHQYVIIPLCIYQLYHDITMPSYHYTIIPPYRFANTQLNQTPQHYNTTLFSNKYAIMSIYPHNTIPSYLYTIIPLHHHTIIPSHHCCCTTIPLYHKNILSCNHRSPKAQNRIPFPLDADGSTILSHSVSYILMVLNMMNDEW